MVDSQVRPNGITDGRIIDAMLVVAREQFVPEAAAPLAYMEGSIDLTGQRALMSALGFAKMLQAAEVRPEDKILIVGAGSGYGAEVAARLAAQVFALEEDEDLIRRARVTLADRANVTLVESKLVAGHTAQAPYDVILIEGRAGRVPEGIVRQLADGGRLVSFIGEGIASVVKVAEMKDGTVSWRRIADCPAPVLPQFAVAAPGFVF